MIYNFQSPSVPFLYIFIRKFGIDIRGLAMAAGSVMNFAKPSVLWYRHGQFAAAKRIMSRAYS